MGSLFSSPAAGDSSRHLASLIPKERLRLRRPRWIDLDPEYDANFFTIEATYARCICRLVHRALKHYNANNPPGAELEYPATEMKAACVGFRDHLFWYHLGFSARRSDNQETHRFFAEMCYDIRSPKITVETCTILEEPLCRFRSRCAFCPQESNILHPNESEFVCGKEGQQTEFFRKRDMLVWPFYTPVGTLDL